MRHHEAERSYFILIRKAQGWSDLHLSTLKAKNQIIIMWTHYRHNPWWAQTRPTWGRQDNTYCSQGWSWGSILLVSYPVLISLPSGMVQELIQSSSLGQLPKVVMQSPTIFYSMFSVLVVLVIEILVSLYGISPHFVWPLKVWLILYFS